MKIALIGYGKMGHLIEQIAVARGHEVVCIIDIDNREDFDSEAFARAEVAIEFTNPTAAYGNICKAWERGVKVVTGSTGWMQEHGSEVERMCREEGKTLFWASNFSLGVYLFDKLNVTLARLMNPYPQYDVRMEEVHHVHKLDAPSGTAITLAEHLVANLDRKRAWAKGILVAADGSRSGEAEAAADVLAIDSIRRGEVPGIHTIRYNSQYDEISITHDAHNRGGFALGAVLAAEYTLGHKGLLTMDDMMEMNK